MRSLVENHIGDFLEILTYEKSKWEEFWKKLPYKPITEHYAYKFPGFYEKLNQLNRNDLTELSHWYDENKEKIKDELTIRIRKSSRDFQLSREDFVIYLIVGIGEKDWVVVDGKSEKVIVFDVFSLWKKGKIDKLADAVYQSVVHFRHDELEGDYYDKSEIFEFLKDKIITAKNENLLETICQLLDKHVPYYNWTGFYLMDNEGMLVLGPYIGEPTEHVRIPVGKGICGQAAETKHTFIIQDVSLETNYLSCSPHVKSEIVVPIFKRDGSVFGEIDIDSHYIAPFDERDQKFLEWIAKQLIVRVVHWDEFKRRIKIAYLDSYLSYLLSELLKYNITYNVDLYVHFDPEMVPENLYRLWRISDKSMASEIKKIYVVDDVKSQKAVIYNSSDSLVLDYDLLKLHQKEVSFYLIRNLKYEIAQKFFDIHYEATRLAQSFINSRLIIEYALKPDANINTILYAFLTGITAGYSGSFNRAMFFYYSNGKFIFQKAIGPRTIEEAHNIWEAIEDIELNMKDFLETVSKDFKSALELLYTGKTIDVKYVEKYIDGEPHVVSKEELPEICEVFDVRKEFAIISIRSGENILGLLFADNNFDLKPVSDYQLSVLKDLAHQMTFVLENRRFFEAIKEKAEIDLLTGLKTRRAFEEFIGNIPLTTFSVAFIDLNKFKMINDIYGHEKGDEVLRKIGKCINMNIRKSDLAFRYGGDEFIIILDTINKEIIERIVKRILECLESLTGITFSTGVALYPSEGDINKVIKLADKRCYKSKVSGKIEFEE
ncbi:MAG: diguanylate cyclase domain-containing protein [Fervidobacterium sp.]|jgi:diguanylate cyclase (GGDEF)-like protein